MPITFRKLAFSAVTSLALLACGAGTAQAEVTKQDEGGFVSVNTATVAATPYETWLALIAPGKWWSANHTWSGDAANLYISAQGGGCFCELLPEDKDAPVGVRRGSAQHMVVLQAAPPRVLRMRGGLGPLQGEPATGVLTVTLKPVEGGTRILFEYVVGGYMRYKTGEIAPAVDAVLRQQLGGLVKLLGAADGPADAESDSATEERAAAKDPQAEDAVDEAKGDSAAEEAAIEKVEIAPSSALLSADDDVGAAIDAMGRTDDKDEVPAPAPVPR
ncbi:MAG: SRPBCC family protein [Rhodobacteraceae bacterium]|nr:SRPBCC family protein [Paracoccaceae bacterium]